VQNYYSKYLSLFKDFLLMKEEPYVLKAVSQAMNIDAKTQRHDCSSHKPVAGEAENKGESKCLLQSSVNITLHIY
jgi:hypothetical protein